MAIPRFSSPSGGHFGEPPKSAREPRALPGGGCPAPRITTSYLGFIGNEYDTRDRYLPRRSLGEGGWSTAKMTKSHCDFITHDVTDRGKRLFAPVFFSRRLARERPAQFLAFRSIVHVECDVHFAPLRVTHSQAALRILPLHRLASG